MKESTAVEQQIELEAPARPARKRAAAKTGTAGAPTRPAKGRRSPEELQARILAAAIAEFAEHSYSGARIDKISKRAKTVDRMLYYYFGSKERLYQAVLEHLYAEMVEAQRSFVQTESDPVEGMKQLIAHSWHHYNRNPDLVRLLMTEHLLHAKYVKKSAKIRRVSMPLIETIGNLLESGQRQRVFRSDIDAETVLMTVMALGFFYVSNHHTCSRWLGVDLMESQRRDAWLAHITGVVLGDLRPR